MTPKQSPLFEPAIWAGSHFKILDETLLPWKLEYLRANEVSEAVDAVRQMKTRAFGQVLTFLYAAALEARAHRERPPEFIRERLKSVAADFTRARPTFNFQGLLERLLETAGEMPAKETALGIEQKIHDYVASIRSAREERTRRAAELLPDRCRLLTHCNISGEIVAVGQWCEVMGKKLRIIATETRPYLQGTRLTAWESAQAGLEVEVIPDCAIAQVMARKEVDVVLVGADRCAQNGDIINKVGTYSLALMARHFDIPFYALVQPPGALASGADVLIEERPVAELLSFQGIPLVGTEGGKEIEGRYPAFDVTPGSLISALISFDGIDTPQSFRHKHEKTAVATPRDHATKENEKYLLVYGVPDLPAYSAIGDELNTRQCRAVLVPEMRPELWGARVVTRELLRRDIPTTLISDNMMGFFFGRKEIQRLYLYCSDLGSKGAVSICGSLLASLLARAHGVPVEILSCSGPTKEKSPDRDVATLMGRRVIPDGVGIYPVQKELLPRSLLNGGVG
ncbi:MAG: hypothetical protein HY695_39195 [Deltaproteobacteria bacterium]|nr:hypothetical protein [Deltaproteobacteria bacterium]